jgi:DNA-binding CsgD family transcriptional regulator
MKDELPVSSLSSDAPICPGAEQLSPREKQIAMLVAKAKTNKEIAYDLGLKEGTIKDYLFKIYRKVKVANRTELAVWLWGIRPNAVTLPASPKALAAGLPPAAPARARHLPPAGPG